MKVFKRLQKRHNRKKCASQGEYPLCVHHHICSLEQVPSGCPAIIHGFLDGISASRQTQLRAYGLMPGQSVTVLQHNPVTVIRVFFTELALEQELAQQIQVKID